jgi:hypothetical protein
MGNQPLVQQLFVDVKNGVYTTIRINKSRPIFLLILLWIYLRKFLAIYREYLFNGNIHPTGNICGNNQNVFRSA